MFDIPALQVFVGNRKGRLTVQNIFFIPSSDQAVVFFSMSFFHDPDMILDVDRKVISVDMRILSVDHSLYFWC